jgi:hypothetical protein
MKLRYDPITNMILDEHNIVVAEIVLDRYKRDREVSALGHKLAAGPLLYEACKAIAKEWVEVSSEDLAHRALRGHNTSDRHMCQAIILVRTALAAMGE